MDVKDDQRIIKQPFNRELARICGVMDLEYPQRVIKRLFNRKSLSHLGSKEKYAITSLYKLFHFAKNQEHNPYDNIETLGYNANHAVLLLDFQNDLPTPYDIPTTSTGRGVQTIGPAMKKVCKNAKAWIREILNRPYNQLIVFENKGDLWNLKFKGKCSILKDSKGIRYIVYLLARPNKDISALEVARGADQYESHNQISDNVRLQQDVSDKAAITNYGKELHEIEEDLDKAKDDNDEAKIKQLSERKEKLLAEISEQTRRFPNNTERARKSVSMNIGRAFEKIQDCDNQAYRYLKNSIHTGQFCKYSPTE